MMHTSKVLVIIGSVRARRICPQVAAWVAQVGRERLSGLEVVDLKDWPLPMDDEPAVPAAGGYDRDHTRAWSARVAGADGVVFVTPQYNWGYPAALKNALDHLYAEWAGKPAMIVSYGGHGGERCAEQLAQVLGALKMTLVPTRAAMVLPREHIVANTGAIDAPATFAAHLDELRAAFGEMQAALTDARPGDASPAAAAGR